MAITQAAFRDPGTVVEAGVSGEYFRVLESTLAQVTLSLSILGGWHINGPHSDPRGLIPTSVDLRGRAVKAIIDVIYPRPQLRAMPEDKMPWETFEGDLEVVIHAEVNEKLLDRENALRVALRYQPCSNNGCFEPVDLVLPVKELVEIRRAAFV